MEKKTVARPRREQLEAIRRAMEEAAHAVGVPLAQVYLFGSQARGEADDKSDWDFLVIVRGELSWEAHRRLFCEISQRLAKLGVPADLVIRTERQVTEALQRLVSVEKTALQEGVPL